MFCAGEINRLENKDSTVSRQRARNTMCVFEFFNNTTSVSGSFARRLVITSTDKYVVSKLVRTEVRTEGFMPTRSR